MKHKLILLVFTAAALLSGAEYQISDIKLTLANKKYQAAYDELKYHLELAAGKLAPGKDADIVAFDENVNIQTAFVMGKQVI